MTGWVSQLCLWSLNPATAFRSISEQLRAVILTAGTLSPLDSFASEARPGSTLAGHSMLHAYRLCIMQHRDGGCALHALTASSTCSCA